MRDGFRIFDAHTHVGSARHTGRSHSADDLLRDMDRFGVDRSLAMPFPVVEDYRAAHDEIGRAALRFPGRIDGAASPPVFIPEQDYRDEVRRCAEQWGFRALKLQPQYQALNPASPRGDFLFRAALENRMAVICHTGSGVPYSLPSLLMAPARNYPDLKIVAAHAGGGLFAAEAVVAASFCPNIWLELSSLLPHQLLEVVASVPPSRLMIGSDLPENLEAEMSKILRLDLAPAARAAILWDTPESVFGAAARS